MGFLDRIFPKKAVGRNLLALLPQEERLSEIVTFVEEREGRQRLPSLTGQKILEIAPRQTSLVGVLQEKGGSQVIRMGGTWEKSFSQGTENIPFVLSHWETQPFLEASWDFVWIRMAFLKGGWGRLLHEASRTVKLKGCVFVSDLHPFSLKVQGEYLKSAVTEEAVAPGFERYFKWFHESGFRMESIHEVFYDGSLKKFFPSEQDKKELELFRKTPLMIQFMLGKV